MDHLAEQADGHKQRVAGCVPVVLLAAGEGRRLGQCKPLLRMGEHTLIEQAILKLRPLTSRLIVVLGYQSLRVRLRTRYQPHLWVANANLRQGQSSSLQAGLERVGPGKMGTLICPVDQPSVPIRHYHELIEAAAAHPGQPFATRVGATLMAPAYLPRSLWPAVLRLSGDQGARALLAEGSNALECDAAGDDIDTPADAVWQRMSLQF